MRKMLSFAFIVLGVALLFVGTVYPRLKFVVVVADDTPPVATSYCPQDGVIYSSLIMLSVSCKDLESGIQSVTCKIDGTSYILAYTRTLAGWEIWQYSLEATSSPNTDGGHSFTFTTTNTVGLSVSYSGGYQIYTGLKGNWYVNDVLVTSDSQILRFQTLTLTFKFVKMAGKEDSQITCNVAEGGSQLLVLTYQGASTWTGSYKFVGGAHTLGLRAYDGVTSVTMSLLNIDLGGGATVSNEQLVFYASGVGFIGFGGYRLWTGKKRSK